MGQIDSFLYFTLKARRSGCHHGSFRSQRREGVLGWFTLHWNLLYPYGHSRSSSTKTAPGAHLSLPLLRSQPGSKNTALHAQRDTQLSICADFFWTGRPNIAMRLTGIIKASVDLWDPCQLSLKTALNLRVLRTASTSRRDFRDREPRPLNREAWLTYHQRRSDPHRSQRSPGPFLTSVARTRPNRTHARFNLRTNTLSHAHKASSLLPHGKSGTSAGLICARDQTGTASLEVDSQGSGLPPNAARLGTCQAGQSCGEALNVHAFVL